METCDPHRHDAGGELSPGRRTLLRMVLIGAHLHEGEPLAEAQARKAEILQIFLGDPQGWKLSLIHI